MRVLQEGHEDLGHHDRQLWLGLAGWGMAVVLAGVAVALRRELATFVVPPVVMLATVGVSWLRRVRKGRRGERLVTRLIKRLPDDYYLVNDVRVEGRRRNIDHVVVGPCGAVVIETKRLGGRVECHGDEWYVNGRRRRGNISRQANRGAVALGRFLAERHPDVDGGLVRSIAVFTHPLCRLEVNRARATVVRYSELLEVLLEMGKQHRMSPVLAGRIAATLAASQPF